MIALYARCSTNEDKQDISLQVDPLVKYAGDREYKLYTDYASGSTTKGRPQWQAMMEDCRAGKIDIIVVTKLDRFSRSIVDFLNTLAELNNRGIIFVAIEQKINTDKDDIVGKLMLHIMAAFAEFERGMIRERVISGIEKRKKKGLPLGKQKKIIDIEKVMWLKKNNPELSLRELADVTGIKKDTLARRIKEYESTNKLAS